MRPMNQLLKMVFLLDSSVENKTGEGKSFRNAVLQCQLCPGNKSRP